MFVVKKLPALAFIFASIFATGPAYCWTGKVVGISDGDTITVLTQDKQEMRIRIYGVDCPEKGQDFGSKAKQFTSDKVFGKTVEIDPISIDRYGRTIGIVDVNGLNLSRMLIESGMAWVYEDYCRMLECDDWRAAQHRAKSQKIGIWSMASPTPPWDFRHADSVKHNDEVERSTARSRSTAIHNSSSPSFGSSAPSTSSGRTWVDPYIRKDGTEVKGHWRSEK
ncbi:MAG: thermonuclease family protein [Syntrophobacteraceae bacterium]|nr:thermonuclease family protein [Syntrophobacteraceae bacterium]